MLSPQLDIPEILCDKKYVVRRKERQEGDLYRTLAPDRFHSLKHRLGHNNPRISEMGWNLSQYAMRV
jgi:hypothetical protein